MERCLHEILIVNRKLDAIYDLIRLVAIREIHIMATLDQVLQDVTDETTAIDSVSALVKGLKAQLADVLSGATLPPDVQAKVDAIFTVAETNKGKIADALAANVAPALLARHDGPSGPLA